MAAAASAGLGAVSPGASKRGNKRRGKRGTSNGGVTMIAAGGRQIGAGRGKHDLRSVRGFDQHMTMCVDRRDTDDMLIGGGIERGGGRPIIAHRGDDNVAGGD